GNLICCDFCHNIFCKKCILRNLGRKALSSVMEENRKWYCYICFPEPLLDLVTACDSVFENLEQLWQQNKAKSESDKGKMDEHGIKNAQKEKSCSNCNGQDHCLNNLSSGTVTYSYKTLKVPKDLIKKTQKLVETTASLTASFVKFLKEKNESQRRLKAFKSVLGDLKNSQLALEEALDKEILELYSQCSTEATKDVKRKDVDQEIISEERESLSIAAEKNDYEELDSVEPKDSAGEVPEDSAVEAPEDSVVRELEDSMTEEEECKDEPASDPEALDKDIVSVPASVPEDIFENANSSMDAMSSLVEVENSSAVVGQEPTHKVESTCSPSNKSSKDSSSDTELKHVKVVKYVKLTPVSLVEPSHNNIKKQKGSEAGKENNVTSKKHKVDNCSLSEKQNMSEDEELGEDKSELLCDGPNLRTSPCIKTTPLRRPSDKNTLRFISEKESSNNETPKWSSTQSKKQVKKGSMDEAYSKSKKKSVSRSSETLKTDGSSSDSDDIPEILKEASKMNHSSSDADSNDDAKFKNVKRKSLFGIKKENEATESGKWKRKSSGSDSDWDEKTTKTGKSPAVAKKKRQKQSDSSNYDSDLEKELKNLNKIALVKKSSKRSKKKKSMITVLPKMKMMKNQKQQNVKRSIKKKSISSSSSDEEEEADEAAKTSAADDSSDEQKIKPVTENPV
uniref:DNA helicase n=1 Tax=Latimeria chalumnae TaxID=7897 RepID=H3AJV2_LATCH